MKMIATDITTYNWIHDIVENISICSEREQNSQCD